MQLTGRNDELIMDTWIVTPHNVISLYPTLRSRIQFFKADSSSGLRDNLDQEHSQRWYCLAKAVF